MYVIATLFVMLSWTLLLMRNSIFLAMKFHIFLIYYQLFGIYLQILLMVGSIQI